MNPTLRRLLGVTAAAATGAAALLGTGVGAADAAGRAHHAYCDRSVRPVWTGGDPSRNMTAHGCDLPDDGRRWYTVEVDDLVEPHYRTDYLDGGVERTETTHDRTIRCMGYISHGDTVDWFGCVPH
ncbi:hypothetical protein [Streptomyces cinerochromogenes]|uniref:hypothetical protein n=1 Tax=Streptomyces cinerochromogenes TaxID=66422 RepID=UPI00166FE95B|nr:hypothetical protein [Streptomyces cinerochromogenes]GGS79064.1 hypothetical protein GCM10010206_46940 [Streptomyces cinerochromogenes]